MTHDDRALARRLTLTAAAILALALPARGQSSCDARPASPADTAPALLRPVTMHARDLSLREALDRLAAAGHLRISYSAELLPVDRRVCAAFDGWTNGQALRSLLRGLPVRVVAAGGDQVVLAPGSVAAAAEPSVPLVTLDRLVVTGTPEALNDRSRTASMDVVDGHGLERQGVDNLAQALNGNTPGVWMWAQSPSSLLAQYGSIRGASSFGVSAPKVYIDGIEVANPLLLTHIDASAVDRVEVIRGPQGGALYGANSISGVTNIVTRHETQDDGASRVQVQSGVGFAGSDYGRAALAQDYRAAFRGGSTARSAGLNLSMSSLGAFIPGAYGRSLGLDGGVRAVGSRSLVTGTVRLYTQDTGTPVSPLLAGIVPTAPTTPVVVGAASPTSAAPNSTNSTASSGESVVEYTVGVNGKVASGRHWTHSATVGVDGYRLKGVPQDAMTILSPADSALKAAQGGADRGTLRLSSVGRFDLGTGSNLALTLTAERSVLRQQSAPSAYGTLPGTVVTHQAGVTGPADLLPRASWVAVATGTPAPVEVWRNNTGVAAQLDGAVADRLFVTGGLRLERDADILGGVHSATLPMLGVAWVTDLGGATVKLRSSYGKGIRWPQASVRDMLWATPAAKAAQASLGPEQQSGIETGFDVMAGRALSLKVTRFDQVASGLVQRVIVATDSASRGSRGSWGYQLQNVGRIGNHGWEMQATTGVGPLSATGALSIVDSRVEQVATGYTGELRPGDRALEVPARTASITGTWTATHGLFSLTAYRALDWVNYDRLDLARALADGSLHRPYSGLQLRRFWQDYPGVTHLRATLSRDVRRGVALTLTGDNLLDRQRGEPDDITILPGRTFSLGVRAAF